MALQILFLLIAAFAVFIILLVAQALSATQGFDPGRARAAMWLHWQRKGQ